MRIWFGKLGGRKFVLAVFGALAVALHSWLGIDADTIMVLGGIVASYLLGQGFADGLSGGATSTSANIPAGKQKQKAKS